MIEKDLFADNGIIIKHARYTWTDKEYQDLMFNVVAKLEPRREEADVLLIDELDEFLECLMFISGYFKCGYCLNRK